MDLSILQQKEYFPRFVCDKLSYINIDYEEKYSQIKKSGSRQIGAGVVLLLRYKEVNPDKHEYIFQLIKRSSTVSQSGDISCPGGMLHPRSDIILSYMFSPGIISRMPGKKVHFFQQNNHSIRIVRLFLANALREAWEEIGLNPFNTQFLGALPCYTLSLFTRTIFPLVCLVPNSYKFKLSSEVEMLMEIPISAFFERSNYARLELEMPFGNEESVDKHLYPCILLPGENNKNEILWGATYSIIMNFLRIISDDCLPVPFLPPTVKKVLSINYVSGSK